MYIVGIYANSSPNRIPFGDFHTAYVVQSDDIGGLLDEKEEEGLKRDTMQGKKKKKG